MGLESLAVEKPFTNRGLTFKRSEAKVHLNSVKDMIELLEGGKIKKANADKKKLLNMSQILTDYTSDNLNYLF